MKKSKLFSALTVFIVILSLVLTATITASAATVKINKSKLTLDVGDSATVKILNTSKKVTWTSSSKSIATVSAKGKIVAKKAGTATITGKIGTKKYKCKVTVKNPIGSRQRPADVTKGLTFTEYGGGKFYFKVTSYTKEPAIEKLKELGRWDTDLLGMVDNYEDREAGTDLLVLQFDVKAISGYDESALMGWDVFNSAYVYNEKANKKIENFKTYYLYNEDLSGLSLYDGGEDTVYCCALVPEDLEVFTTNLHTKNFKEYWLKYKL